MPFTLERVIAKIDSLPNPANAGIIKELDRYLQDANTGERHRKNLLLATIYFGVHIQDVSFLDISKKEEILAFLNTKAKSKEDDPDERWRVTWNHYLNYLIIFFKWLHNQRPSPHLLPMEDWEIPGFMKIRRKKIMHETYANEETWDNPDDVMLIVKYMPELRNKLALTFLWDVNGRNHEVTKTEWRHIKLTEQYGEGEIPANTKTGTRGVLLLLSFNYTRDYKNQYPFVMHPRAPIIPNLMNGKHVKPDALRSMLIEHRDRCKRLLAKGRIDQDDRERMKYLIETKKWNPYCFRHSSIDYDLAFLPEFAGRKKVGWSMNSKMPSRYMKRRMNQSIKMQLLTRSGIVLQDAVGEKAKPTSRICPRCGQSNAMEVMYCTNRLCTYPLRPEALEEIKAKESQNAEMVAQQIISIWKRDPALMMKTFEEMLSRQKDSKP